MHTYHFTHPVSYGFDEAVARVTEALSAFKAWLAQCRAAGMRLGAYGAAAKGNTLLNYARITSELIEKVTEVNQFKIGRMTPGTHIPIVDERMAGDPPDYYLVLSWNFLDYFISKYKEFLMRGGKFIVSIDWKSDSPKYCKPTLAARDMKSWK